MSLRSRTENENESVLHSYSLTSPSFPHAFSATGLRTDQPKAEAGIQAEFGLDPRLTFGGDGLGNRVSSAQPSFRKSHKR